MRFDFETWLAQNYGMKVKDLTMEEIDIARREYEEEYPSEGESEVKLKTYPFKVYLDRRH